MIAAKNHANGAGNPYAQMRRDLGFDLCNTVSGRNPCAAGPLRRTDCSIGSIKEVRLQDGSALRSYATEFLISGATATPQIALDAVDLRGVTAPGVIAQGDNPVLITAEIILTRA